MANEHWYGLKVRSGFEVIAAQRLRKLNLEVLVPEYPSASYLYCRFALENRHSVISIPGVLDILGTPDPTPVDADISALQSATSSRR